MSEESIPDIKKVVNKSNIRIIGNIQPGEVYRIGCSIEKAVEILYEAFSRKISALIKSREKAIEIHKRALKLPYVFFALLDGEIIGIAGLHYSNQSFLEFRYTDIRKSFNPFKSVFYYFVFRMVVPKIGKDVIRIDSLAVDVHFRGNGVGTMLIEEVCEFARKNGFREVMLEVVDTNPRAKALYERLGFVQKKVKKYYFLTRSAGFSSESIMSRQIEANT
ncbi:MAG: GNAT family N-acetyltransferase [Actinobacteria bacterium]|nr:GNAT family N-acetyltransferase [Actinomycetota bacterium]